MKPILNGVASGLVNLVLMSPYLAAILAFIYAMSLFAGHTAQPVVSVLV